MRKMIAIMALAFALLLLFGCAEQKKTEPGANATAAVPEKAPPKTYRMPLEEKKPAPVPNVTVEAPKGENLTYYDNEFGISFERSPGADFLSGDCRYWGGSQYCRAMVYHKDAKVKLVEYSATPSDIRITLRRWLEGNGMLDRKLGNWYEANFSSVKGIELDASGGGVFSKTLYLPIAGNILKIAAYAKGADIADANRTYSSLLVGGNKGKRYYPLEFECGFDTDCLKGEYCVSRSACTRLDPENSQLNDFFGSSIGCASGGPAICRRACKVDADCPRGQQCFLLKRVNNDVQTERLECA